MKRDLSDGKTFISYIYRKKKIYVDMKDASPPQAYNGNFLSKKSSKSDLMKSKYDLILTLEAFISKLRS